MHDLDSDIAWMAALDWSRHRTRAGDYQSDHLMLASVVDMLARAVCGPYPMDYASFLSEAGNTPPGSIVSASEAFTSEGLPIHSVHVRLDETMRRHADELNVPIVSGTEITFSEWEEIIDAGRDYWSVGQGARRAIAGLAPLISEMAAKGMITCHARPIGGGVHMKPILGREWWDTDLDIAIRRVASCSLSISEPFSATAPVDHLIFVERASLEPAIIETARKSYVGTAFLEEGDWFVKRRVDYYAIQVEEVAAFLIAKMDSGDCDGWNHDRFKAEVMGEFGTRGLGRCYERARAIAVSDDKRKHFKIRRRSTP